MNTTLEYTANSSDITDTSKEENDRYLGLLACVLLVIISLFLLAFYDENTKRQNRGQSTIWRS